MQLAPFNDLIDPGEPIYVVARVTMLKTENGGKTRPFGKSYRPNHNFGDIDSQLFYVGQIEVPEGTLIHPGETHDLSITFLPGAGLRELLRVGVEWRIQEGNRLVGSAQVLRLCDEA